jgi:TetR/AcrR family transcriptional regulator, transcriptional repressor for nem operon
MPTAGRRGSDERLDRAVSLFWERGYYDVSVDELVNRTGLHRAAVYGEFGSRQRLFEAALRRYRARVVAVFFAELERPDAGLAAIERFFVTISGAATRPKKRIGCLMINTASEVSPSIRSVAHIVSSYLDDLRARFQQACVNARARGEIRHGIDVDQVADYLLGSVLGLWVLARSPASTSTLQHYVQGVLMFVDGLRSRSDDTRALRG